MMNHDRLSDRVIHPSPSVSHSKAVFTSIREIVAPLYAPLISIRSHKIVLAKPVYR